MKSLTIALVLVALVAVSMLSGCCCGAQNRCCSSPYGAAAPY